MSLRETLEALNWNPESATIFAERSDGKFLPESRCAVIELSDEDMERPITQVAKELAPGMEYFLEVFIAHEILEGLLPYKPSKQQIVDFVIYYAEHDAYPGWANELCSS